MTLSHVTREEAVKRLAQSQAGAPDSIEALCDLVRAEATYYRDVTCPQ